MIYRLPPLNALRVFEAAARHLSFKEAAQELSITQAAVSHQIKSLEEYLGMELFRRAGRGVQLTEAARSCLPKLGEGFGAAPRGGGKVPGPRRGAGAADHGAARLPRARAFPAPGGLRQARAED